MTMYEIKCYEEELMKQIKAEMLNAFEEAIDGDEEAIDGDEEAIDRFDLHVKEMEL